MRRVSQTRETYDLVADEYARRLFHELQGKPLDRQWLERLARSLPPGGLCCDLGCGPGQVGRYLSQFGLNVIGIDLSPAMVARAQELSPQLRFETGDMRDLKIADRSWDGIAAFYSIVNIPRSELPRVFSQMHRVLKSGGRLLLAFHLGDQTVHLDEWWDRKVAVDFYFFESQAIARLLTEAGFQVEEVCKRDPYPEVEHPSRRGYIFCSKP